MSSPTTVFNSVTYFDVSFALLYLLEMCNTRTKNNWWGFEIRDCVWLVTLNNKRKATNCEKRTLVWREVKPTFFTFLIHLLLDSNSNILFGYGKCNVNTQKKTTLFVKYQIVLLYEIPLPLEFEIQYHTPHDIIIPRLQHIYVTNIQINYYL